MDYVKEIIYYLLIINSIGFFFMYIDKRRAIKGIYRISEKTLLSFAIIGGSLGILIGMKFFKHKTKKNKFKFGVPVIIFIQIILVYCFKLI